MLHPAALDRGRRFRRGDVHPQGGSFQGHPGEEPPAARVGKDLGLEAGVGIDLGLPAQGARRHGHVRAQRELSAPDAIQAAAGLEDEHQVGRLHSQLMPDAEARQADEDRRAPRAVRLARQQHAPPMPPTDNEAGLEHIGNNGHSLGIPEQGRGDTFQRDGRKVREHVIRFLQDGQLAAAGLKRCPGNENEGQSGQDQGAEGMIHRYRRPFLNETGARPAGCRLQAPEPYPPE